MFKGTNQPWRLGAFFGDEKFAVHKNWTGCMRELEGACNQNSMAADTSITKELTNNLYNSKKVLGNGTESKGIENTKLIKAIVKLICHYLKSRIDLRYICPFICRKRI